MTSKLTTGMANFSIELAVKVQPRATAARERKLAEMAWEHVAGFAKMVDLLAGKAPINITLTRVRPASEDPLSDEDLRAAMEPIRLGVVAGVSSGRSVVPVLAQSAEDRSAVRIELSAEGTTVVSKTQATAAATRSTRK